MCIFVYKYQWLCGCKCTSLLCSTCPPTSVCVAVNLSDVPVCASISILCVYVCVPGQIYILCVYVRVQGQGLYKTVGFNLLV